MSSVRTYCANCSLTRIGRSIEYGPIDVHDPLRKIQRVVKQTERSLLSHFGIVLIDSLAVDVEFVRWKTIVRTGCSNSYRSAFVLFQINTDIGVNYRSQ